MAEHRRLADLSYGHPGLLTYIPRDDPENGPGILHTSRVVCDTLNFEIVGSSAELYPPSKRSAPEGSTALWQERQVQQRWLSNSHPEVFLGGATASADFLKEDMDRFEKSEESNSSGALLAVGEMTDMRDATTHVGMPLLVVVTGSSGQQLRLARMEETGWRWDDHKDATLNLSTIDAIHREEEAIWQGDGLPITKIKFATAYWPYGSLRWLLVQSQTSVTILHPEYHRIPMPGRVDSNASPQMPSYITPNPLITLHHRQTGGNALSDVCFNPPSAGSPPQISVIDECGYWSIWSLLGTWQVAKNTLRLSLHMCGHVSDGILDTIPRVSSYPAQRYGMLQIGRTDREQRVPTVTKRDEDIKWSLGPSQHILVWNSERISLIDLKTESVLPDVDILSQSRTKPDWILDIQSSPVNENHVFVLTARQVIWLDLLPPGAEPGTNGQPQIILTCSHVGFGNENAKMSVCRVSDDESDGSMVFVHLPSLNQLTVYWFTYSSDAKLPQWHRYITAVLGESKKGSQRTAKFIRVQPARLTISTAGDEVGLGTEYARAGIRFYQVTILDEDLGVRYCICTTSTDPSLDVSLPTSRIGWSKSQDRRRWKQRRKHFLRHMGSTFVLPDGMTDDHLDSLLKKQESKPNDNGTSDEDEVTVPRPVYLNFGRIAQTISSDLQAGISEVNCGLPTELVVSVQRAIERGLHEDFLPLTSWMEILSTLEQPLTFEGHGERLESETESLLETTDENVVVTQLRRKGLSELPSSPLGYSFLEERFSHLWLGPTADSLPEEMRHIRKGWVVQIARDMFLSSYGVMVQNIPLFGPSISHAAEESQMDVATPQSSQLPYSSQAIASSSQAGPVSTSEAPDAVFQRLRLLAPTIMQGASGSLKQSKILSYWPKERGVDPEDYVSTVAAATEEKFSYAKRRLQRIEAKRRAQSEKYKRPAFMRQGFPASDGLGEDTSTMEMRPPPVQAMSSQQQGPDSSQSFGFPGPSVTMSQPVSGVFGDRKKVKKGKRKSGFR